MPFNANHNRKTKRDRRYTTLIMEGGPTCELSKLRAQICRPKLQRGIENRQRPHIWT